MTANASLADREACTAAGMNDHGEADRQGAPGCFACSVISAGAARGAPATAADAGELVEARGDIVGRFGGSSGADRPVLRRFVPDMQDLFAQLERQLGEGDVEGSAATLHTIKGSASTVGASATGRASELEQALRRADPLRGMEILAGIRLDGTAAPCAMPACSGPGRRCSATCRRSRRAEPRRGGQSRQGFRRTRVSSPSAVL